MSIGYIYFSFSNLLTIVWICAGAAVAAMAWLLTVYASRLNLITRRRTQSQAQPEETAYPPVSVIVHSRDNSRGLARILPQILGQEYPAAFEVIVINDGSTSDTTDVVNLLANTHKNLHITFVPDKARNLSRKKLGISLGVKAASHPYVVLTTAECTIPSATWLKSMATPFAQGFGVSLGTAHITGLKHASDRFDMAQTEAIWLSAALSGHPYRGTGYNIGYNRDLFFEAKGFSKSLTMRHGDDDLFIRQIITPDNCAVVLTGDSIVEVNYSNPSRELNEMRLRHSFTARFLPHGSSRLFGFSSLMLWLWLAATATGIVFSLPNALPGCIFLLLAVALWWLLGLSWRKTANAMGIRINAFAAPWLMLWHWIRTLRYTLTCGRASRRNYTWLQR